MLLWAYIRKLLVLPFFVDGVIYAEFELKTVAEPVDAW